MQIIKGIDADYMVVKLLKNDAIIRKVKINKKGKNIRITFLGKCFKIKRKELCI